MPFLLPSPSLLLQFPIVVTQKCCYHGNVTSLFSSLLTLIKQIPVLLGLGYSLDPLGCCSGVFLTEAAFCAPGFGLI